MLAHGHYFDRDAARTDRREQAPRACVPRAHVGLRAHEPAHRAWETEKSVAPIVAGCPSGLLRGAPVAAAHDADEDNHGKGNRHMPAAYVDVESIARPDSGRRV